MRKEGDVQSAQKLIAGALPPLVASILTPQQLESMRQRLLKLPEPPARARLGKDDWRGAFAAFLLVFLSTFPVAIPFLGSLVVAGTMALGGQMRKRWLPEAIEAAGQTEPARPQSR